ncbi:FAD-binding oxidoreductase [Mesonia sp. K7]|uniref:NAD(P)/FAD-dependent oxidoreductase n=1 Tax=Mesonia sp. K7 TaxID=2218606 RepID=UPI000DA725B7|nr:FAD-binding oxidoreductase [Mesonia sp. K7]PZD78711.1 hypothetical protein DNG35_04475 [Mesonia sp. K7]
MKQVDFIILGFGIAGLSLCRRLEQANKTFLVIANNQHQSATKVAGGIISPINLGYYRMLDNGQELYENAKSFFKDLDSYLNARTFKEQPIYKVLKNPGDQNDWLTTSEKNNFHYFMEDDLEPNIANLHTVHKFGKTKNTALIDTVQLLNNYKEKLQQQNQFEENHFSYDELKVKENSIAYKGYKAKYIVFCEGSSIKNNPYFQNMPINGNKGEYITIKSPALELGVIVKHHFFIIPQGNDLYKVGATYERDHHHLEPTEKAKREMVNSLNEVLKVPFEVVQQEAGERPTVYDRNPIIGAHKSHKNIFVCNGFGSRGLLFAPKVSSVLVDFILRNKSIPKDFDVARFY